MNVDQALERADYIVIPMTPNEEAAQVLAAEVRRLEAAVQHWYDKVEAMRKLASSWES